MNAGDRVRVDRADQRYEGVLLPSSTADHLVVKLDGGYNVGIDRDQASVDVLESDVYDVGDAGSGGDSTPEPSGRAYVSSARGLGQSHRNGEPSRPATTSARRDRSVCPL